MGAFVMSAGEYDNLRVIGIVPAGSDPAEVTHRAYLLASSYNEDAAAFNADFRAGLAARGYDQRVEDVAGKMEEEYLSVPREFGSVGALVSAEKTYDMVLDRDAKARNAARREMWEQRRKSVVAAVVASMADRRASIVQLHRWAVSVMEPGERELDLFPMPVYVEEVKEIAVPCLTA